VDECGWRGRGGGPFSICDKKAVRRLAFKLLAFETVCKRG